MKKEAPKQTKPVQSITPEVMSNDPLMPNMSVEQTDKIKAMLGLVATDMANAALGRFYALRAGIGLKAIKGLFPHGEWEPFAAATFAGKSTRTLRLYMQNAEVFFLRYNTTAEKAWASMYEIDGKLIDKAASQLLLGDGKASADQQRLPAKEIPKIIKQMVEYLSDEKPAVSEQKPEPSKKQLTAKERVQAATDLYFGLRSKLLCEVMTNKSWQILSVDDQEGFASSLHTAYIEIMTAVKKAQK